MYCAIKVLIERVADKRGLPEGVQIIMASFHSFDGSYNWVRVFIARVNYNLDKVI